MNAVLFKNAILKIYHKQNWKTFEFFSPEKKLSSFLLVVRSFDHCTLARHHNSLTSLASLLVVVVYLLVSTCTGRR